MDTKVLYAMNYLVVAVFVASIPFISAKLNTTNIPETSYLFSFFHNDEKLGLYLAYSTDGYKFEVLNDDKSLLKPEIGDKILRDPCILYGPDGVYHMVWTTSWTKKQIGYSSSKDLIHWSTEELIPVMHDMPAATDKSWAPELVYNYEKKHYVIFWTSTPGTSPWHLNIYATTTTDFKTFTQTKILYDGGSFNAMDATLLEDKDHNGWLMFMKNDNIRKIQMTKGQTAEGPWANQSSNPITGSYDAEGPTAMKIGNYYHVYFDKFVENKMGMVRSTDLNNWEDMSSQVHFPPQTKHGTIFKVTRDMVTNLSKGGL